MKKSIFLCLVAILILGGTALATSSILQVATENSKEGVANCIHSKTEYESGSAIHLVKCQDCNETLYSEAHVDENNDMCCDLCKGTIENLAPSEGEAIVESEITLNESIKISIKANKDEISKIVVSSWFSEDEDKIYDTEAMYNTETKNYETEINFKDVNGKNGTYCFDAILYNAAGNFRYLRMLDVAYTKNGISNVTTNVTKDGTIEVNIEAIEGGEIFIGINGEDADENSNWQTYSASTTYKIEDPNEEVKALSVYYSNSEVSETALPATTFSVSRGVTDNTALITKWEIPNDNTVVKLPTFGPETYLTVDWGDGSAEETTTQNHYEHTYEKAGEYLVTVTGTCYIWGYPRTSTLTLDDDYYSWTQYATELVSWGELGIQQYIFSRCENLVSVSTNYTENTFIETTTIEDMFYGCIKLKSVDLSNANMPNLSNMARMFYGATNIETINLNNIDVSNVTYMTDAFCNCENLKELNFSVKMTTSATTNTSNMFSGCKSLTSLDLSTMNTQNVSIMFDMFKDCEKLESIDLSNFDVSKATDFRNMFMNCSSLKNLNLDSFCPSNVTDMSNMFYGCSSLQSISLNNFDTSSTEDMTNMFTNCSSLQSLDISKFNTSNVTNMTNMFGGCTSLKTLDLSNFNTSKVIYMDSMFFDCTSLGTLDLTNFKTNALESTTSMFTGMRNLKSILFSNKFIVPTNCTNMFSLTNNLKAIILTDSTPASGQFKNTGTQLYQKTFYVPTENAKTAYVNSWSEFGESMIQPMLELVGEANQTIILGTPYVEENYKVAGFDIDNIDGYTQYGYNVLVDDDVNADIPGEYSVVYTLVRYINGNPIEIMSKTRKVTVETVFVETPTKFSASEGLDETVVVVSWKNAENTSLKYELWYREEGVAWTLLEKDAVSEYNHIGRKKATKYEYRIRAYNEEGYYSDFLYATGSTIIENIKGEAILDTVKPVIVHKSNNPDTLYSKADAKIEITFEVADLNYYLENTKLTKEDIVVKIEGKEFQVTDATLEKKQTASGEEFKYTINKIPYYENIGTLSIVIPENKVFDKALNGNDKVVISTGVTIVNSSITTNAPTLSLDEESNEIDVTCNQETNFMPEEINISYEYRKVGETEFKKSENNIITNLVENVYYEIRTVLTDITGNSVASDVATIKTVYLPVKVSFSVENLESGSYVVGTNIEIIAQFNVSTIIENVPTLTIKFGEGNDILLNGIFNSENKNIIYNYTTKLNDLGKLTGVNFRGSLVYAENLEKEYNDIPEILGSEIIARTGAINTNTKVYYSYIQDAINNTIDNTQNEIKVLQDEELTNTILVNENKNIILDLNGKDVSINEDNAIAIINNGTLVLEEDIGTGEIIATGKISAKTIENNNTLTILGGIYRAKLENAPTGATAIYNSSSLTIGENDGNVSILVPLIDSKEYGVQTLGFGTTNFYDGVIEGARDKSYTEKLNIPAGNDLIVERIEQNRERAYISTDKIPPTVNYNVLTPGWQKEYVEVEITAYDADSGIRKVTLDNDELVLTDLKTKVRLSENKEYVIYVEDNASNSATKIIKIDTIDVISPKIYSVTANETDEDGIAELILEAQDLESGLAGVILKEKDEIPTLDEEWYEIDEYPTSKQFISMQIEKNKIYYCFAKDRVGNITRYDKEIQIAYIDKIIPVIQNVYIEKDEGKDYVSGKTVIVNINATDNVGVSEVLISNVDLTNDEAKLSNDWKAYNNKIIHKLPVEGDKTYTIYIWVKDLMGNISTRQTASVKLKSFVVGDNETDYTGEEKTYNKTTIRFLVKDYHFNFEESITEDNICLRITSGDKIIRNITSGYKIKKISDYNGVLEKDFEYVGEIYELEAENLPNTGNLSLVLLEGTYEDLARNKVNSEVRVTDIFVDNSRPIVTERKTGTYTNGYENIEFTVTDKEGNLLNAIEVDTGDGILETYSLTNGKITLPLTKGDIIYAYDIAGNKVKHQVDMPKPDPIEIENLDEENSIILEYGGASKTFTYKYNGDGVIYPVTADSNIANISIDTVNKEITVLPVNAGNTSITLRAIASDDYLESSITVPVIVKPRAVSLTWSEGVFDYNGRVHEVTATVTNTILKDVVNINLYSENKKINAGKYTAEAKGVDNYNYTVEDGTNITFDWEIKKIDRVITLDRKGVIVETGTKEIVKFVYTGEDATPYATVQNESILSAKIIDYANSGEIELNPVGYSGETIITLTVPESINYNIAEETFSGEVIHKVWLNYDVQSGDPIQGQYVIYGKPYGETMPSGELPLATRSGEKFAGWFFKPDGKGGRVTEKTIVKDKDRHSIYACWNQPPEFTVYEVSSKTTSSLTFAVESYDPDDDDVRYRIYVDGKLVDETEYIPHQQLYTFTLSGLKEYTYYEWYIIADDTYEESSGDILKTRTLCSGTGYTCRQMVYCKGYENAQRPCTGACNLTGKVTLYCSDGYTEDCTYCDNGEVEKWCSGGSVTTCSTCEGSGTCPDEPVQKSCTQKKCSCGGTYEYCKWGCNTCGVSGYVHAACSNYGNGCNVGHDATNNHWPSVPCPKCKGSGQKVTTCRHKETSAHYYDATCSMCGGDMVIEHYCSCGNYKLAPHYYEITCPVCGGDGIEDYTYMPCDAHGQSGEHYYCATHDYNSKSSSHVHCIHGIVGEHDDLDIVTEPETEETTEQTTEETNTGTNTETQKVAVKETKNEVGTKTLKGTTS